MSYNAAISRANPSCFLFLIDQSGSMEDSFGSGESTKSKSVHIADAINRLLQELVIRCARAEGARDYFHIGVLGYGNTVGPAFVGELAGRDLVLISEVANAPAKIEERVKKVDDGAGGLVDQNIKFPLWFEPVSNGGTPMCQVLSMAENILQQFLVEHPSCFPPVVIHLTDGESTDGDPTQAMQRITSLSSTDGNVLLFNCHLSSSNENPIAFPNSSAGLPDQYATMLFETASQLTPTMIETAKHEDLNLPEGAKAFVFNADSILVIQALEIGTRTDNLR